MTFTSRELRRGMDVFSADGVLLGSVVQIRRRAIPEAAARQFGREPAPATAAAPFTGEALGPMPTAGIGNSGPARQNATTDYAAAPPVAPGPGAAPADFLVFRTMVHLDWSMLWPRLRRYPVSLIQNISHERIVLSARVEELP